MKSTASQPQEKLTRVRAAVHPEGSHPLSAEVLGSYRAAVAVAVDTVPISTAVEGEGGVVGVAGGAEVGAGTGAGVVPTVSERTKISVCAHGSGGGEHGNGHQTGQMMVICSGCLPQVALCRCVCKGRSECRESSIFTIQQS